VAPRIISHAKLQRFFDYDNDNDNDNDNDYQWCLTRY